MRSLGRRGKTVFGGLALVVAFALVQAASASAATFPNVCLNTASTDPNTAATQLPVDMTANSPATVAPGDPVTLSNIDQTLTVPATIFVTGYNLGLVLPGQPPAVTPTEAVIDATAQTDVAATNTAEGVQTTNLASGSVTTTVTDPDGTRATGDETATPGALSVTYADLNWTAGGSAGTIDFREDTVSPISAGTETGALIAKAIIFPGVLTVTFACSPATVSPNPGPAANIAYDDPAVAFQSTEIAAANTPPVADAGADQTVDSEQAGVSLDGSGSSDPDGDPITYSWTQTSGPAVSLSGADTATPSFDAPVGPATLEFELTVDDGEASDTDTVAVNVKAPAGENTPPIADAGPDQTVDSEQAGVSLDGSGSTDPDGDPITYSWTQTSGPAVSLSGADTATPSFDAPVGPATLEFELEVCDAEPLCDTDTVAVNVNAPAGENTPPIADAGADQTVASEQAGVTLDGSGSTDPDGDPITYSWTQTSGPAVSLSGADTATPSFDAPVGPATLEFELEVCDAEPLCDTDTVVVNVNEPVVGNQPPVADAGPDQTAGSEQAGVSLDGSGSSDPDGDPITYSWTQTSGPSVSLSGADTATPSFDAPVGPATLEFELTVDDGQATDADMVAVNVKNAPLVESGATFPNVCLNTASTDPNTAATSLPVDMTVSAPATVAPGGPVTLSNIDQTLTIPATIFVTGYNLGLVLPGQPPAVTPTEAVIDATAQTDIEATNTVEGIQTTNLASGSVKTTVTDPDGTRATGDESATPGVLSVSYADQSWTAGGSVGTIGFREDTVQPLNAGTEAGALIAKAIILPGVLEVTFACSPGTVSPNPGPTANIVYDDPALFFAKVGVGAPLPPNTPPIADAGADQTAGSEQAGVSLDGSGSSDSDGDPITYSWTQTSGPAVSLSGADTATPSFDAPVGPATLEFELTVDDGQATDADTVAVNVNAAPEAPEAPDTKVKGSATAKQKQKQKGKKIVVKVKVKAKEDLKAKASGKVKVKRKSYKLQPQTKSVSEGKKKTLKLKPKKRKDAKKIFKALKKGKKAKAKLTVELTDEAGNKKLVKFGRSGSRRSSYRSDGGRYKSALGLN